MNIELSNLLEYLKWHRSYINLRIDIKNVREMKLFLFGYEKGMNESIKEGQPTEWISQFNEFTERKLRNHKDSSQDWASYIEINQSSDQEGLKIFYDLFDEYLDNLTKPIA